jgi:hypothetical protein
MPAFAQLRRRAFGVGDAAAGLEDRRPHVIDEHERPDAARLQRRHRAAYLESTEVVHARRDEGGHAAILA